MTEGTIPGYRKCAKSFGAIAPRWREKFFQPGPKLIDSKQTKLARRQLVE
jgi:hypothetical protein